MSKLDSLSRLLLSTRFIRPQIARGSEFPPISVSENFEERPAGIIVWLHVGSAAILDSCAELIAAIHDRGHSVLITTDGEVARSHDIPNAVSVIPFGADTHAAAKSFLRHWQPNLCIWLSNALRTALILRSRNAGVNMIYANAAPHQQPRSWRGSVPNFSSALLSSFKHVLAVSTESRERLIGFGLPENAVEVTGSLQTLLGAKTLPVVEGERATFARHVSGRPVWLVVGAQPSEVDAIVSAHKQGARMAQRLLMIVQPENLADSSKIAKSITEAGLKVECRTAVDLPRPATDVLLADVEDETGLWYRIAPVTYFGGSLSTGMVNNPFEAAALGSAILHGPKLGEYQAACQRLGDASAAIELADDADLGAVLIQTVAPDAAAELAHAAWQVSSAGAEVNDRVLELVEQILETQGAKR